MSSNYFDIMTIISLVECFRLNQCNTSVYLQRLLNIGAVPPETGLKPLQLIRYYGYPAEAHDVTTEDGYILQLHRIPNGRNASSPGKKQAVYMVPGLLTNSIIFMALRLEMSLPFLLVDAGYDVWIGNPRGTSYSRRHITIDPDKEPAKFFNFTLTEEGKYDLPACIDYILKHTGNEQVILIGLSKGTTEFFIMASERPEYNKKVKISVHMAPTAYLGNTPNPFFRFLAKNEKFVRTFGHLFGFHELLPHNKFLEYATLVFCNKKSPLIKYCVALTNLIGGWDPDPFDENVFAMYAYNFPEAISLDAFVHYGQIINSGKFQQFDYGKDNILRYGRADPPEFNLSNIDSPVALYYGLNDGLSAPVDVQKLARNLPNLVLNHLIEYKLFSHIDFVASKLAKKFVYDHILDLLKSYK